MAISPSAVLFRGSRRVRILFSGPLAAGAFTSLAFYSFVNDDGNGASPIPVVAVFAVASNPNAVELAIASDLTSGALYTTGFTAVPAVDTSTFTGTIDARMGLELQALPNEEPETDDLALLLYGRDIAFLNDVLEDATGDLLTISGRPNWRGAMNRRFGSYGLNWDPSYGPRADEYIDAPSPYAPALAGSLVAQARLDDRTKQATVSLTPVTFDPNGFVFKLEITGKDGLDPIALELPFPTA